MKKTLVPFPLGHPYRKSHAEKKKQGHHPIKDNKGSNNRNRREREKKGKFETRRKNQNYRKCPPQEENYKNRRMNDDEEDIPQAYHSILPLSGTIDTNVDDDVGSTNLVNDDPTTIQEAIVPKTTANTATTGETTNDDTDHNDMRTMNPRTNSSNRRKKMVDDEEELRQAKDLASQYQFILPADSSNNDSPNITTRMTVSQIMDVSPVTADMVVENEEMIMAKALAREYQSILPPDDNVVTASAPTLPTIQCYNANNAMTAIIANPNNENMTNQVAEDNAEVDGVTANDNNNHCSSHSTYPRAVAIGGMNSNRWRSSSSGRCIALGRYHTTRPHISTT